MRPPLNTMAAHSQLTPLLSAWNHSQELLLEGFVGEEDIHEAKKLENLEQQLILNQTSNTTCIVQFQGTNNCWSHPMMSHSSPKSCVTNNMFDFSHKSECNSDSTGGAAKKARVQPSSAQSTFKVSKEKLGALHQIVSPFGKTDTASVLLEAIGYIRFLQSQIEALSLPYLGTASRNMLNQHHVNGEKNCFFPEDPGQLLNENCMKRKGISEMVSDEESKGLRSKGLCLVPLSSTLHVGSENGAYYWAPAFGSKFP